MNQVSVNAKWCKSCGLCAEFCLKKVFDFLAGTTVVPARQADCVGCRQCELKCPELAITVEVHKE